MIIIIVAKDIVIIIILDRKFLVRIVEVVVFGVRVVVLFPCFLLVRLEVFSCLLVSYRFYYYYFIIVILILVAIVVNFL